MYKQLKICSATVVTHPIDIRTMCFILSRAILGLRREKYPLELWIDSGEREEVIDPDLPIVDAHHHLWDARTQDKGWPVSPLVIKILYTLHPALLTRLMVKTQHPSIVAAFTPMFPPAVPYMANEILRDILNLEQGDQPPPSVSTEGASLLSSGHNIVATVYVESGWSDPSASSAVMRPVPEVGMAQEVADKAGAVRLCTGIVGKIDLSLGGEAVLEALQVLVDRYPNFRGVRDELACRDGLQPVGAIADKAYGEGFRSGLSALSEFPGGLTFDTYIYQDNIPALRDLALAFPETIVICDHVGGPASLGEPAIDLETAFMSWAPAMKDLAESCPNVVVKLSGLGMATVGLEFDKMQMPPSSVELAEKWGPYIRHCVECFGVDRCMFASNFPVDKVSCSYTGLFNAFKLIVKDFSYDDKKKLFHDNAIRIYRLDVY